MTTSNNRVFFLVKVFSEERYADNFIKGSLLLNTLGYFKRIELNDGRGDSNEGISHWIQPLDIKNLIIDTHNQGKIFIEKEDIAGPITVCYDWVNKINVFCMYSVGLFNIDSDENNTFLYEEDINLLNEKLAIDSRCLDFGHWAVIVPAKNFTERMKTVLYKKKLYWRSNLVDYYDEKIFSGSFDVHEIPFKKHKFYEYQKEFRYCIFPENIETAQESRMFLEIGDISSFAIKIPTNKLMNAFQLNFTNKNDDK